MIISDHDQWFVRQIWRTIFKDLKVNLLFSTAWHSQTDGMSERMNAMIEIALQYWVANLKDPALWPTVLAKMSAVLNNLTKFSTTNKVLNKITYRFKTHKALNLMRLDDHEDNDINEENSLGKGEHVIKIYSTNTVDIQNNMPISEGQ